MEEKYYLLITDEFDWEYNGSDKSSVLAKLCDIVPGMVLGLPHSIFMDVERCSPTHFIKTLHENNIVFDSAMYSGQSTNFAWHQLYDKTVPRKKYKNYPIATINTLLYRHLNRECKWEFRDTEDFGTEVVTSCGNLFEHSGEPLKGYKFCPYCGGKVCL